MTVTRFQLKILGVAFAIFPSAYALAQTNVSPQSLIHYAYCIEQASENDLSSPGQYVNVGETETIYRCHGDIAVSYFNDLGRLRDRKPDRSVTNTTGAFVLRPISNIGFCWHKTKDVDLSPISKWGCDLHVPY